MDELLDQKIISEGEIKQFENIDDLQESHVFPGLTIEKSTRKINESSQFISSKLTQKG